MLVRYNPWQELNVLQRQMNRLFEETRVPSTVFEKGFMRVPPAELNETADAIALKLEIPGIEAKDLDVQVTKNAVYISAIANPKPKPKTKERLKANFATGNSSALFRYPLRLKILTSPQNTKMGFCI